MAVPGATALLILDFPAGGEFGIDMYSFRTGAKFVGVRDIPLGMHMIYYAAVSKSTEGERQGQVGDGDTGVRSSEWIEVSQSCPVVIRRWNAVSELLLPVPDEEVSGYCQGLREMHFMEGLAPYPSEHAQRWHQLASNVTPALIERVQPVGGIARASVDPGVDEDMEVAMAEASTKIGREPAPGEEGEEEAPEPVGVSPADPARDCAPTIFFSRIPSIREAMRSAKLRPDQVTQCGVDRSFIVDSLAKQGKIKGAVELVGELELGFLMFLLGQSFEGFEQWKALLDLLTGCEALAIAEPGTMARLCTSVRAQMIEVPEDMFYSELSKENFISKALSGFFEMILESGESAGIEVGMVASAHSPGVPQSVLDQYLDDGPAGPTPWPEPLVQEARALREAIHEKFGIDFSILDDSESAPAVVPLDG